MPGLLALCFSSELWGLFSPSAGTARTLQPFSSFAKSSYSCEYGSAKDPVLDRNPDIPLELGFVTVSSGHFSNSSDALHMFFLDYEVFPAGTASSHT